MFVNVSEKRVTVVGLGVHGGGIGTVQWLLTQGARVLISDRKDAVALVSSKKIIEAYWKKLHRRQPNIPPIQWALGVKEHPLNHITGADLIIVNPDVDRRSRVFTLAKHYHIPLRVGDTSLFIERYPGSIVGITGTRGKTTTATLIGEIFKRHDRRSFIGGNLRISPLEQLDFLTNQKKRQLPWAILELSSWQVEGFVDIKKSPRIAVITNLMPDHLNRYTSMNTYARAKAQILRYQGPTDIAILNADDKRVKSFAALAHGRVWWTSRQPLPAGCTGVYVQDQWVWIQTAKRRTKILSLDSIRIRGDHMIPNVLCAIAVAMAAGVSTSTIVSVVKRFRGVPGRLEFIATVQGVRYYNDTTATIPEAAIAAVRSVNPTPKPQCILIAGGADKKLHYEQFVKEICPRVKILILFEGDASIKIRAAVTIREKKGYPTPLIVPNVADMAFAVKFAHAVAQKGDTVILSPAAASFGVFAHAYDRGDQFKAAVKRL